MNLVELFGRETELQALPAGKILFNEGDHGNLMYVIMSGAVTITVHNKVVATVEANSIVGEMGLIDEGARSATVTAQRDCMLLPIGRERFNKLIQQTPDFALHIMGVMSERLRKANEKL